MLRLRRNRPETRRGGCLRRCYLAENRKAIPIRTRAASWNITRIRMKRLEFLALTSPPRTIDIRPRARAPTVASTAITIKTGRTVDIIKSYDRATGSAMRHYPAMRRETILSLTHTIVLSPPRAASWWGCGSHRSPIGFQFHTQANAYLSAQISW